MQLRGCNKTRCGINDETDVCDQQTEKQTIRHCIPSNTPKSHSQISLSKVTLRTRANSFSTSVTRRTSTKASRIVKTRTNRRKRQVQIQGQGDQLIRRTVRINRKCQFSPVIPKPDGSVSLKSSKQTCVKNSAIYICYITGHNCVEYCNTFVGDGDSSDVEDDILISLCIWTVRLDTRIYSRSCITKQH